MILRSILLPFSTVFLHGCWIFHLLFYLRSPPLVLCIYSIPLYFSFFYLVFFSNKSSSFKVCDVCFIYYMEYKLYVSYLLYVVITRSRLVLIEIFISLKAKRCFVRVCFCRESEKVFCMFPYVAKVQ